MNWSVLKRRTKPIASGKNSPSYILVSAQVLVQLGLEKFQAIVSRKILGIQPITGFGSGVALSCIPLSA